MGIFSKPSLEEIISVYDLILSITSEFFFLLNRPKVSHLLNPTPKSTKCRERGRMDLAASKVAVSVNSHHSQS